jgi:hypothetical protein
MERITMKPAEITEAIENYCYTTLKHAAEKWLTEKLGECSTGLTPEQKQIAVAALLAEYDDDVRHHVEEVIERGFNDGRLGARCRFLTEDWDLEGWDYMRKSLREQVRRLGGEFTPAEEEDDDEFEHDKAVDLVIQDLKQRGIKVVAAKPWACGAIDAFALGSMHEFSPSGGDGIVEIRFVDGIPQGVYVRAIKEHEKATPETKRGKIANWELSPEQLKSLFSQGEPASS